MAWFLEDLAKAVEAVEETVKAVKALDDLAEAAEESLKMAGFLKATNSTSDDVAMGVAGVGLLACAANIEDPDDDEMKKELKDTAIGVGVGLLACGTKRLLLGSSSQPPEKQPPTKRFEPKDMVAPGRNPNRIPGDEFVADPKRYFHYLHQEEKSKKKLTNFREPDMVAPGKNPTRIYRDEFEANPSGYFRDAREQQPRNRSEPKDMVAPDMGVGMAAWGPWGTARLLLGSSSEPPEKQPPTKRQEKKLKKKFHK